MPSQKIQVPPNCDLTLGMRCVDKATPGRTVWTMTPDERMENPIGLIQGGFLGAFVDSAMGAAAISSAVDRKVTCINTEMTIRFLGPVRAGETLRCEAEVITAGRQVAFLEATVRDTADRIVVRASSTYLLRDRK